MKRPGRDDDSLGALISMCPNSNEGKINNCMYAAAVMEGYEEEQCVDDEESWQIGGSQKKRRLRVDQVKALEKTFAVENKLEPERKVRLAVELGLQPRQVAVWFQNRRARWKTKQLERDYGLLRAAYDGLRLNFEKLQRDNEVLMKEIHELKSKMNVDDHDHDDSSNIKQSEKVDEVMSTDSEERRKLEIPITTPTPDKDSDYLNLNDEDGDKNGSPIISGHEPSGFKDGSSDSDNSSAVLNEEIIINKNHNSRSSPRHRRFSEIAGDRKNHTGLNSFQFQEPSEAILAGKNGFCIVHHHHPFVKMEEHNFLGEESCSTFFSDDQPPSLHWYEWS